MIDIQHETVVTFNQARKYVPERRQGRPLNISTLYRWATGGIRGIKLETLRAGGGLVTSVEAIQRFFERLSGDIEPTEPRTAAQRRRASERAAEELEKLGI